MVHSWLERVPVQQPVREGSTNQLAAPQLSQLEHPGRRDTVGSLRRRSAIDTLMATFAVPIGLVFAEIPLQLLDTGNANVIEQGDA